MELQKIEKNPFGRKCHNDPRISINPETGQFYFNAQALDIMGIKDSAQIALYQDKHNKQNWYINKSDEGYATISRKFTSQGGCQVYIKDIAENIIKSLHHIGYNSLYFRVKKPINVSGDEFYPLELIMVSLKMKLPKPESVKSITPRATKP